MAISTCAAILHILPAYSKLPSRNKAHPNVIALTRSNEVSSLIPFAQPKVPNPMSFPRLKASRISLDIMRTISEKDDQEILDELKRLQNSWEMLKRFCGEIILVLMATNPILLRLADAMVSKDYDFIRCSSVAASYGALTMLKECVKVLWRAQPIWGLIVVGFLIYKANMCNISLVRKGCYPVWLGPPLIALFIGKSVADCSILLIRTKLTPLNIILGSIEIIVSLFMALCFYDCYILSREITD